MKVEGALERYLKTEILPQLAHAPYGEIKGTRLSQKMPVCLLQDDLSHTQLVGKAFQYGSISLDSAWERATKEYESLRLVREKYGMSEGDFQTVAPLGKNRDLAALLVISYGKGNTLDHYISKATNNNETTKLYYKLRLLARFLVKLHKNSESNMLTSPEGPRKYLKKLLGTLCVRLLSSADSDRLKELASLWWNRPDISSDHEVLVHGDATPTNFLFRHDKVTGIDLEKAKWADRCWDLGFMAAELKHHFLLKNKSSWDSEPFIRHLLLEYAAGFRDLDMFHSITRRLPLYMALGLLRIARNDWLDEKHRYKLVEEAKLCLKYKA